MLHYIPNTIADGEKDLLSGLLRDNKIDCILMVVANGMSTKREIEDSMRHLSKANLIGTVFNKA